MKVLRVEMPDGSKWDVPAELIAESRARYFAKHDAGGDEKTEEYLKAYTEEFETTMNDEYELMDWASNNMDWEDVKDSAKKFSDGDAPDYQDGWTNGDKWVVVL